ncbi:MAG TPA: prolipoprotein diacylglyceryl transferase [Caulobacteraceae bacterium]|nr:prolipoprotein diacylglyceryl transferase [Caulobacteraceae bacterium]
MPFPNFNPVLLQLGPVAIRWYALAYVAGILLGWRYAVALARNLGLWRGARPTADEKQIDDLVLWITLGVILGGRIGYVLFYKPALIWTDPVEILRTWNGGMSFHGGLIGVTLALFGFAVAHRIDVVRLADLTAPVVPIGLFFGRIANFINGELWGRPTDAPWGMVFCNERILAAYGGACPAGLEPRHPSQLYEASLEGLALFLILGWAVYGGKLLPRKGAISGLFLTFYGLFRILLETVREPDIGMPAFPFGLTMGMMLSVPLVLAGLALIFYSRRPAALAPPDPTAGAAALNDESRTAA